MSANNNLTVALGKVVTIEVYWYSSSGALATPSTTTWVLRKPSQTTATATSVTTGWTTVSTGRQTRSVTFDEAGLWLAEARGAGNSVDDVRTYAFDVIASRTS